MHWTEASEIDGNGTTSVSFDKTTLNKQFWTTKQKLDKETHCFEAWTVAVSSSPMADQEKKLVCTCFNISIQQSFV